MNTTQNWEHKSPFLQRVIVLKWDENQPCFFALLLQLCHNCATSVTKKITQGTAKSTTEKYCGELHKNLMMGTTADVTCSNSNFDWSECLVLEVTLDAKFYATRLCSIAVHWSHLRNSVMELK